MPIGHKSGCVKINCAGCGKDFYTADYSGDPVHPRWREAGPDLPPGVYDVTLDGEGNIAMVRPITIPSPRAKMVRDALTKLADEVRIGDGNRGSRSLRHCIRELRDDMDDETAAKLGRLLR